MGNLNLNICALIMEEENFSIGSDGSNNDHERANYQDNR